MELLHNEERIEFLSLEEIQNNVLSNYNIDVYNIENIKFKDTAKQRAVYKVTTNKGIKCLKKVYYDEPNLLFIYSVIEWLNMRGVLCPRLISTKKGLKHVKYEGNLFILTDWIDGRKCDYDNIDDVKMAAENLGKIHKCSKNFRPIEGSAKREASINYFQNHNKHFLQLLELSNSAFVIRDKFSKIYLENFDYNIEKARDSVFLLSQINFSKNIGDEVSNRAICHLDYVNKNILFAPDNKLHVIDFDNTQLDMPAHDIASFLKRILKRHRTSWDFEVFKQAIESYEKVRPLSYEEHIVIFAFLMFPQKFWKASRDYYRNRRECNKEAFLSVIKKIVDQQKDHEEFCIKVKKYIKEKF
jgi:CotS family spore coat protein